MEKPVVCVCAGVLGEGERRMATLRYARDPKRKHPIYLIVEDLGREPDGVRRRPAKRGKEGGNTEKKKIRKKKNNPRAV